MSNAFGSFTPAERLYNQGLAREARQAARARRLASPLRRDFAEEPLWLELAATLTVRLPTYGDDPTPRRIKAFLGRVQRTVAWYKSWSGETTLNDFARQNPDWPMRALGGLILEEIYRENRQGESMD